MGNNIVNPGVHPHKSLVECNDIGPIQQVNIEDKPPKFCQDKVPSLRDVKAAKLGWLQDVSRKKVGLGSHGLCDPMQTGQIVNDIKNPNREVVYRYSKAIRACNEATTDLFHNIVVLDEEGKAHPVPIIWGTQDRAVQYILADNVRKDDSLVVDRIRLPMMAIHSNDIQFDQSRYTYHKATDYLNRLREDRKPGFTVNEKYQRDTVFGVARGQPINITYTLICWTMYLEDIDQMLEQIIGKFSPVGYINIRGVHWETIVTLDSIANNIDFEPGESERIIKYEFNLTAQTYIPQPIVRHKAVLKTKTDFYNSVEPEKITEVLGRLEEAVDELENNL